MVKDELVISLDIGSSSIHGVIAKYDEDNNKIEVLGADTLFSDGVKDGAVIAIQEASKTIGQLLSRLEKDQEGEITKKVIAIRGSLIEVSSENAGVRISENDAEVREDTLQELVEKIEDVKRIGDKQEIIQIIPKEYILDEQCVQNPIGMEGEYLEMDALVVVATKTNMTNIRKAISDETPLLYYGYNSIGEILVSKEDKELGCVLIDLGGMTTGIVVYVDGKIKYVFELPMGADLITRDIVKKLRVSQKEAKNIKEQYGSVLEELIEQDSEFEYTVGTRQQKCTRRQLVDIIKPQVDLQIDYIFNSLKKKNIDIDLLAGGIILTGSGAMLQGMAEAFEKALNCVTKIANFNEENVTADNKIISSQAYTTAIATLYSEYKNQILMHNNDDSGSSSLLSGFKKLLNIVK
ncbi:MAG: cell division protein FtsA [Endomicrobiaceae bacterium]|jgi:cell division protein FtsA|nr:cell division protein FtsA [Endomicrobiaceae bacterium]